MHDTPSITLLDIPVVHLSGLIVRLLLHLLVDSHFFSKSLPMMVLMKQISGRADNAGRRIVWGNTRTTTQGIGSEFSFRVTRNVLEREIH